MEMLNVALGDSLCISQSMQQTMLHRPTRMTFDFEGVARGDQAKNRVTRVSAPQLSAAKVATTCATNGGSSSRIGALARVVEPLVGYFS